MNEIDQHQTGVSPFDTIRQLREDGGEFWSARDLMPLLGYEKWERFADAVERAVASMKAQGHDPNVEASRLREPFGRTRQVGENFHLSRFACDNRRPAASSSGGVVTTVTQPRNLNLEDIVAASNTSVSTVRRAWAKWESGKDDGSFPPPLEFRRKGDGKNAPRMSHMKHVDDWLDRWPT